MNPHDLERLFARLGHDEQRVALRFLDRLAMGRQAYGELDLATDRRDFREEALQEALDLAAYLAMRLEQMGSGRAEAAPAADKGEATDGYPALADGSKPWANGEPDDE
jgi:hypothetical protein